MKIQLPRPGDIWKWTNNERYTDLEFLIESINLSKNHMKILNKTGKHSYGGQPSAIFSTIMRSWVRTK